MAAEAIWVSAIVKKSSTMDVVVVVVVALGVVAVAEILLERRMRAKLGK